MITSNKDLLIAADEQLSAAWTLLGVVWDPDDSSESVYTAPFDRDWPMGSWQYHMAAAHGYVNEVKNQMIERDLMVNGPF